MVQVMCAFCRLTCGAGELLGLNRSEHAVCPQCRRPHFRVIYFSVAGPAVVPVVCVSCRRKLQSSQLERDYVKYLKFAVCPGCKRGFFWVPFWECDP